MIKTAGTILKDLIADVIAATDKISYFGKDGVVRGILHAVSLAMGDLWNDLYQIKRSIFVETAISTDLDLIANRKGITRKAASKSSVILNINGLDGTVIPLGTVVKSISQIQYLTLTEITLGDNNPVLVRPVYSEYLGDIVVAESVETGSKTKVGVFELTEFGTSILNVTVTNLTPSVGGSDADSDDELRQRIINNISLLNQGTQLFYETLSQSIEPTIIKAKSTFDIATLGAKIYLVKDSFASYSGGELIAIQDAVYLQQRALAPVKCYNADIQVIEVQFEYERNLNYTQDQIFKDIAVSIAELISAKFDYATTIEYQDILNIVIDHEGIDRLKLDTLLLNLGKVDVLCDTFEVPRFTYLSISDGLTTVSSTITYIKPLLIEE